MSTQETKPDPDWRRRSKEKPEDPPPEGCYWKREGETDLWIAVGVVPWSENPS